MGHHEIKHSTFGEINGSGPYAEYLYTLRTRAARARDAQRDRARRRAQVRLSSAGPRSTTFSSEEDPVPIWRRNVRDFWQGRRGELKDGGRARMRRTLLRSLRRLRALLW